MIPVFGRMCPLLIIISYVLLYPTSCSSIIQMWSGTEASSSRRHTQHRHHEVLDIRFSPLVESCLAPLVAQCVVDDRHTRESIGDRVAQVWLMQGT